MGRIHHFRPGRAATRYRRHQVIRRNTDLTVQIACADMLDAIHSYQQARRERIRAFLETERP